MALSFKSVQKAYEVFNTLKKECLPQLQIPSWPEDMAEWNDNKRANPREMIVLGWGKKSDDGWESLSFFIKNPSQQLKDRFEELKECGIPNTSLNEPYHKNENLWVIGWF